MKPFLTREEGRELITKAQAGDRRAQDKLIVAFRPLVMKWAKRFAGYVDIDDLVQEGSIGIATALTKFDLSRSVLFGTYARWWIEATIKLYVARNSSVVRMKAHPGMTRFWSKIKAGEFAFDVSLNAPLTAGSATSFEEGLVDERPSQLEVMLENEDYALLEKALARLNPREQEIVRESFLEGAHLHELSPRFGVTKQRIQQIKARALEKMQAAA